MGEVFKFNESNFEKEVVNSKVPVLIDFWASWCVPCKLMTPVIEELAGELKGRVKVGNMNVDENPDLASRLSILNIPTLILFKGTQELSRIIGVNPKEAIMSKIEGVIGDQG